jgi:hypothetical protein
MAQLQPRFGCFDDITLYDGLDADSSWNDFFIFFNLLATSLPSYLFIKSRFESRSTGKPWAFLITPK